MSRTAIYSPESAERLFAEWKASGLKVWPYALLRAKTDECSVHAVYNALRRSAGGAPLPKQRRTVNRRVSHGPREGDLFTARSNEVWRLHRGGATLAEIALRCGMSRNAVSGLVDRRRKRMDKINRQRNERNAMARLGFEAAEEGRRSPYRPGVDPKPEWLLHIGREQRRIAA